MKTKNQKGVTLVLVSLITVIFTLISAGVMYSTVANTKQVRNDRKKVKLSFAVESGINSAVGKIKRYYRSADLKTAGAFINFENNDKADDLGTVASDKVMAGETYNIKDNYYEYSVTDPDTGKLIPVKYKIKDEGWKEDTSVAGKSYKLFTVEAVIKQVNPDTREPLWSGVTAQLELERKSVSNYNVFYTDDLEIASDSKMSFTGPVHSNKNIYLDGSLTFESVITSAGHILRGRKYEDAVSGEVLIKNNNDKYLALTQENDSVLPLSESYFQSNHIAFAEYGDGRNSDDTWTIDPDWHKNSVKNWHGRIQEESDNVQASKTGNVEDIGRDGFYERNAGLKVVTGTNGHRHSGNFAETITLYNENGAVLYEKTINYKKGEITGAHIPVNNLKVKGKNVDPFDTRYFYDSREEKHVSTTAIDVEMLQSTSDWPANGIIYAVREDAYSDSNPDDGIPDTNREPNGIMLENGKDLKKEITFVSNNPVYIKGDFNKGSWKAAAVISDALTLLSNNWDGTSGKAKGTAVHLRSRTCLIPWDVSVK